MSVVVSKRSQSKLEVFIRANELSAFTIRLCSNEKNFPKRYRWCLTSKIVDSIVDMYKDLTMANKIRVENLIDYETRENLQNRALGNLEASLALMDIAFRVFQLEEDKVNHWVGLVEEVQKLLKAWKRSDSSRFKDKVNS